MKKIFLLSSIVTISTSAFAMGNLTCTFSGVENPYQVSFNSENSTATVTMNDESVPFGELRCVEPKQPVHDGSLVLCYSKNVVDGGFSVSLKIYNTGGMKSYFAELYEISIAGRKLISALPCWKN